MQRLIREMIGGFYSMVILVTAARLIGGLVFLWAGGSKLGSLKSFTRIVLEFDLLPPYAARILAYVLPELELITGLLLLVGVMVPFASVVALAMLSCFSIALRSVSRRRKVLTCGCFGGRGRPVTYKEALLRNSLLAILVLLSGCFSALRPPSPLLHPPTAQDIVAFLLAGSAIELYYITKVLWKIIEEMKAWQGRSYE
jgi:uncharacterized membrane protein YphA (DoxX/SURF4 family)